MTATLEHHLETIHPVGYAYAPAGPRLDPESLVAVDGQQRWSRDDDCAMYLGLAPDVVLGEWARHVLPDVAMTAWRLQLAELRVLDLRQPELTDALGLPPRPTWILDPGLPRAIAAMLRRAVPIDGLIVPSVAFLDRPDAGNLVVWLGDRADVRRLVRSSRPIGRWTWAEDEGR